MKIFTRGFMTLLSVFASYYFIFWVSFSLIPGARDITHLPLIISLAIAVCIGYFVWKQTGAISSGLSKYIIMGGIITGSVGFVIGFIGPMIFSDSNQGPLLGIFITGPLGFILGLFGGAIVWLFKTKNK